jgi:crotonobetainyl-CoA:carnitine CoA-transferase CaiB-like acyl-CoA transferase
MMDVQLALLNYHAHSYWLSGEEPQPEGDGHPNIVPYQTFETKTRPIVVAVYGDPFWPGFCRALEVPGMETDPRFSSNSARLANKAELLELLRDIFLQHPRENWVQRLCAHGVPVAPLNSVGEALSSPQAVAREMSVTIEQRDGAPLRLLGSPMKFSESETIIEAPPRLGSDTDQVLATWAGFMPEEIEGLRRAEAI